MLSNLKLFEKFNIIYFHKKPNNTAEVVGKKLAEAYKF